MYICDMETFTAPKTGDTLTIDNATLDIETDTTEAVFTPADEDRIRIARALLGDAPPLSEALGTPEDLANDKSISDGEIRYRAIASLEALYIRAQEILVKTKEQEAREKTARAEARKRLKQINALEAAYLSTQTGRRQQSTQASQNIAEAMYNAGVRVGTQDEPANDDAA